MVRALYYKVKFIVVILSIFYMNIRSIDLNLLIYLDVLLKEKNVTRAAQQLGITQPALSNGLRRLREIFQDPLLIRTTDGMSPTERALVLQPKVRDLIEEVRTLIEPTQEFDPAQSRQVFRIMCSDYAEATLLPTLIQRMRQQAPHVILDCLTPSDVSYKDIEQGKVDMAINRFNELPGSFHQKTLWQDSFSCLINPEHPILKAFTLENYLLAQHIWVSKTGMGVGFGVNPEKSGGLGWIDQALEHIGKRRRITVFTRHYLMPALLSLNNELIATLPSRLARLQAERYKLVIEPPPFMIPNFELKMAWSPLLHHNRAHQWFRNLILKTAHMFT